MKIITQDGLYTNSGWWHAVDASGKTLTLLVTFQDEEEPRSLIIAEYPDEAPIEALNAALINAFSYELDGFAEFSIKEWEEEYLAE